VTQLAPSRAISRPAAHHITVSCLATCLALAALSGVGILALIMPMFGELAPVSTAQDFINHVALVAAALDSWQSTGWPPISSDRISPGVEYPYFLFGNAAFYLLSAFISYSLHVPAYIGAAGTLAAAFTFGFIGIFLLARREGVPRRFALPLAFLYASGPYLSVNLLVRFALPEYLTWQAAPILLLGVRSGLHLKAASWQRLLGSLALAAPFYLHKLIAPYLMLTLLLLALALNSDWRPRTIFRALLVGAIAAFFTLPAWLPTLRGLDLATMDTGCRACVMNPSFLNLIWPFAQDSLDSQPVNDVYQHRFALQVGVLPLIGFLAALWKLTRSSGRQTYILLSILLGIFVIDVVLILNSFDVWRILPWPLSFIQFTYRLVGIAHLTGFILFIQVLGSERQDGQPHGRRGLAQSFVFLLIGLATWSNSTYWHQPPLSTLPSAGIQPGDLRDYSHFYKSGSVGALDTKGAVTSDGWLATPPKQFPLRGGVESIVLDGSVPEFLFARSSQPLVVRLYGLRNRGPAPEQPTQSVSPISDFIAERVAGSVAQEGGRGDAVSVPLQGSRWDVALLAEQVASAPGPIQLSASVPPDVGSVAVECSRVAFGIDDAAPTGRSGRCVEVRFLGDPTRTDDYGKPREMPQSRRTRDAFGTIRIDARGLARGNFLLPTYDYNFLSVTGSDGTPVKTYLFNSRPLIKHFGNTDSYTISYDLKPEASAFAGGLALFTTYAVATKLASRRPRSSR
jgi:hypothetical protein